MQSFKEKALLNRNGLNCSKRKKFPPSTDTSKYKYPCCHTAASMWVFWHIGWGFHLRKKFRKIPQIERTKINERSSVVYIQKAINKRAVICSCGCFWEAVLFNRLLVSDRAHQQFLLQASSNITRTNLLKCLCDLAVFIKETIRGGM